MGRVMAPSAEYPINHAQTGNSPAFDLIYWHKVIVIISGSAEKGRSRC